tara:strand:- start:199 stop:471 length:273 start_codon:yes stop_codon:yes gene_type:complete
MLKNNFFKTSIGIVTMFAFAFLITIMVMNVLRGDTIEEPVEPTIWIPTEQDLKEIDSLYIKVKEIENEVDTLHISVDRIDRKLDEMIESQ